MAHAKAQSISYAPQWERTYNHIRNFTNLLFDMFYSLKVEGKLPAERPAVLLPTHQNSLDPIVLMKGFDEYLAFMYAVTLKSKAVSALGVHINGIRTSTSGRVWFQRLFNHLDNGSLVIAFPQGYNQGTKMTSYKSGIVALVKRYEALRGKQVPVVPIGIEYEFPRRLPKMMPVPMFTFPLVTTSVTIRVGQPSQIDGRTPKELTEIVMREAALLSNISYAVHPT